MPSPRGHAGPRDAPGGTQPLLDAWRAGTGRRIQATGNPPAPLCILATDIGPFVPRCRAPERLRSELTGSPSFFPIVPRRCGAGEAWPKLLSGDEEDEGQVGEERGLGTCPLRTVPIYGWLPAEPLEAWPRQRPRHPAFSPPPHPEPGFEPWAECRSTRDPGVAS